MRIPERAPGLAELPNEFKDKNDLMFKAITSGKPVDAKGQYLHWQKFKYHPCPDEYTPKQWWLATKFARSNAQKEVSLVDKDGDEFWFCEPKIIEESKHWLDMHAAGNLNGTELITNPNTKNTFLVKSLVEESINSSQLEGASTTRRDAKMMIRQGRKPKDKSEQMIYNNYQAMQFIKDVKDQDLSPQLVLDLHQIVTMDTLDEPNMAGKLRVTDDVNVVDTTSGDILHSPPKWELLPGRLQNLCDFANSENGESFIHPAIRAIILHFMLAYDHPFVDGNGRTARALFYWLMAKQGYWLMEFVTISKVIKRAPRQYGTAFLHVETDYNDLTYFLLHQFNVIQVSIAELQKYLQEKGEEIYETESLLKTNPKLSSQLNHRQKQLLKHAIKNTRSVYRIQEHQNQHGVAYQTARKDLLAMAEIGLLTRVKGTGSGGGFWFIAPESLRDTLDKLQ